MTKTLTTFSPPWDLLNDPDIATEYVLTDEHSAASYGQPVLVGPDGRLITPRQAYRMGDEISSHVILGPVPEWAGPAAINCIGFSFEARA